MLKSFSPLFSIILSSELKILNEDQVSINFEWKDLQGQILFPTEPSFGRNHELWKQTCFEAFLKIKGNKDYFEINLSPTGAWNIYRFESYRSPQPPVEYPNAELLDFQKDKELVSAKFHIPHAQFSFIEISLCAILKLKTGETTYWSTHHMSHKPDFHHPECFTLERKLI